MGGWGPSTFARCKAVLSDLPNLRHERLAVVAEAVTQYLNSQVASGAQALMIFDTWGGSLTPRDYRDFSLAYMARIVAGLTREAEGRKVPVILFTKGGGQWLEAMADSGCDALGLSLIHISEPTRPY